MCGIVGYTGKDRCVDVLLDGLRHLEYRGYDSAGLALQTPRGIETIKEAGQLSRLVAVVGSHNGRYDEAVSGIGHTRWATHGRPNQVNAHPHTGYGGRVAVVHNGIIENFAELREELERRGRRFVSETDTEVIAHLVEERLEAGDKLREAVAAAMRCLEGAFAIAVISSEEPGTIVAARKQSPLVVGLGENENYVASAIPALLGRTRRFLVVENGELVTITADSVELTSLGGERIEREVLEVDWDAEAVELGGYEDYMLKEIHEQPAAVQRTLAGRLDAGGGIDLSESGVDLAGIQRIAVVACGTAYHAGLLGKYAIERLARLPVEVWVASEYRYAHPIGDDRTLAVAISQSGETTDTLAAVETARGFGAKVLAITNTQGSLITRESDGILLTAAGPEIAVASTKAFLTQVAVMYLLALELARVRGTLPEEELLALGRELRRIPERIQETLDLVQGRMGEAAGLYEDARSSLFLGRGVSYPVALEGALKLKEVSYIPCEGYPAGEMKHGPIALVDERCPVVAVMGRGVLREKTLSNVEETAARGARVISVAARDDADAARLSEVLLPVPELPELLGPLVASVPLQLLAYRVARDRGLDVDKPRNLAKSVTVE
ncbi:glutamine--fructose-6-phosphate transaminase (isomerizing) [Rubrobacter taiwanensis]|jgi:glucosamine--fructose-6-phosphate aminotransferase (isomerizing)|uniref:Glutamine--fructose-6-phosphate aminotransferase [isomerizing] n=1 Tax=Rubrobacter taiwanensis TaxID=185139 RepID=A0A4R1BDI2_9ACTN|nr:glutamine--fructose-6-phosphate transaminase (isomerizing) [Rubrobacter taiwanensis]TCJ15123.1 glutamine--fructose-6-phosphate transaminase (isomerizing) [Rubrobacter taiwanensis]